ncbi:MAG: S-layer homology domain-containing protein [Candidatus Gracilibacteria bacterium]|nr:S-layer homology domain-containing protein [Candidatus Gracilibacteria bacterium]
MKKTPSLFLKGLCSLSLMALLISPSFAQSLRNYEDRVEVFFTEAENPFPDNNIRSLSGKAATELNVRGVLKGYPDGEFKGNNPVNRAEASKFLLESRNQIISETLPANPFPDVINSEWYAKYVLKCAELEIIKGYPDGTFKPTNQVITAEFLKMLALTFQLETDLPYTYEDKDEYGDGWFWKYAGAAQKYDLFPHRTKKLRPTVSVTRSEMAVAIYQYLKNGPFPRPSLNMTTSPNTTSNTPETTPEETSSETIESSPISSSPEPQLQFSAESILQNIYFGENTFMSLEFNPSIDAEELNKITLLIDNPSKISIENFTLKKEGSDTILATSTVQNEQINFILSEPLTKNIPNRFTVSANIKSGSVGKKIQIIIPEKGIEILFPNDYSFDMLAGSIIIPEITFQGNKPETTTENTTANGYPTNYPLAPEKLQIENGYISYQTNIITEALGLDFNFKSPGVKSVLKDFDVLGDTSQLEEFLIIIKEMPQNGTSIKLGTCTILFTAGGGSDNVCNDGTASVDITPNNSTQLVAASISNITGINLYEISLAQSGSIALRFKKISTPTNDSLLFTDGTNGKITKKILAPGKTNTKSISSLIKKAEFRIDGKIIAQSSAVLNNRIQFRDINFELGQSINYNFQVIITPNEVKSGSVVSGDVIRLFIPANAFTTPNNGSVQGFAGQEFNPSSSAESGQKLIITEAAPLFESSKTTGTNLSVGLLEFLNFTFSKFGTGYIEVGSSLPKSQLQIKILKNSGLLIDRCELRDQFNSVVATITSTSSGQFSTDPFGLTPVSEADLSTAGLIYGTFTSNTFSSGKLMESNGENYAIFCSASNIPSGSSVQVSIDGGTQQFLIDSGNTLTPLTGIENIKKLPLTGTTRTSNN